MKLIHVLVLMLTTTVFAQITPNNLQVSPASTTIFAGVTPSRISNGDSSVEVGTQFQVAISVSLENVQFYKSANDTSTSHTVSVWDNNRNLLSQAATSNETASGWQTQALSTRIVLNPGVTYTVSVHMPKGFYPLGANFFANPFPNYPFTAMSGAYNYSAVSSFPSTASKTNYYVDAGLESVTLKWTGSTGDNAYNVYRGTAAGKESPLPIAAQILSTTYTDVAIAPGTTYFYTVTAVSQSTPTNEASAAP